MRFEEYQIPRGILASPSKFKKHLQEYIEGLVLEIERSKGVRFSESEVAELLLSAFRVNDYDVLIKKGKRLIINCENVWKWINNKLIPTTVLANIGDEEILKLLLFCIVITYKMFSGGTKATVTQKGFRERKRTFEAILVDQFIGKLGEVMLKKYISALFGVGIEIDWKISTEIERYKNDIVNAKKRVSIKTSSSLSGVWAEADVGYDYGVMVKCSIPQAPILQFFIEVCGFLKLVDFIEKKLHNANELFKEYLEDVKEKIKDYKCGVIQTEFKGFICGYFETSKQTLVKEGKTLPYLGKVRETRHLVRVDNLKYTAEDWERFLKEIGIR